MKIEPISFSVFNQVCIYLTRPTKQQVMLCKPNIKRREWKSLKANKLKKKKKATNQPSHTHTLCLVAQLCPTLGGPMDCSLPGSSVHGDSPGKNTGLDCHALLQGIFPTQGSNPGLPQCKWILHHLSYQGSPHIYTSIITLTLNGLNAPTKRLAGWMRHRLTGWMRTCAYLHFHLPHHST